MSNALRIRVTGLDKMERLFKETPKKIKRQDFSMVRKALRSGMTVVRNEAKQNAPKGESKDMRASVAVYFGKTKGKAPVVFVGPNPRSKRYAWYAHFVEFGTADKRTAPLVRRRTAKGLLMVRMKRGQRAQPFMTPAFRSKGKEAIKVAGKAFWLLLRPQLKL